MRWLVPALLLCSCTFFRTATVPMPAVHHPAPASNANGLIILLPGLGDGPSYYESNGFVDMIHAANPRFDVICADAHLGYYKNKSIVERLHDDLIANVADRYEHIWMVGISLGGLGCVAYAADRPGVIDGMILLAPYMGSSEIIEEVRAAGGPRTWTPPDQTPEMSDSQVRFYKLWTWYHNVANHPEAMPKLFLGYGESDRFAKQNGMVAQTLIPKRQLTRPGGHKWTVWQPLFEELVQRALGDLKD